MLCSSKKRTNEEPSAPAAPCNLVNLLLFFRTKPMQASSISFSPNKLRDITSFIIRTKKRDVSQNSQKGLLVTTWWAVVTRPKKWWGPHVHATPAWVDCSILFPNLLFTRRCLLLNGVCCLRYCWELRPADGLCILLCNRDLNIQKRLCKLKHQEKNNERQPTQKTRESKNDH